MKIRKQLEEQQRCGAVKFERYLADQLGLTAVQRFQLYLQGKSQEAIAWVEFKSVPVSNARSGYHAVRVFSKST